MASKLPRDRLASKRSSLLQSFVSSTEVNSYFSLKKNQVIQASEVSPGVKTFGYSLAGDMDMDNNGYPGMML